MDTQILKLPGIELKVVNTQRPYPHQLQISPEKVDKHGEFIHPIFTHPFPVRGISEIIVELSALFQLIFKIDILLKIFRIGMHGSQFKHIDDLSLFTHPFRSEEHTSELQS